MAASIPVFVLIVSLHLLAFVFAVGAERRRSTARVVPDQYDERTFCQYDSDASTVYGLAAIGLLLVSQAVVNGVTKCLCFGRGLVVGGGSTTWAIFFFIFSCILICLLVSLFLSSCFSLWVTFLGAESCLLAGSARNAYHTKYRGMFGHESISCSTLRKGVFTAGAALTLLSMVGSIFYYRIHSKADTGGWEKHQNDQGIGMVGSDNVTKP